jgi:hypothetical protein
MSTKEERDARSHNRKPQLNIEATKEEKAYFALVAKKSEMKLAALIRSLIHAEGKRLGIVPPSAIDSNGRLGVE